MSLSKKIMILSSDTGFVDTVTGIIAAEGREVSAGPGGLPGYDLVKDEKPDVLLLDIGKKDVSGGLEIVAKLRDLAGTAKIPVIVLIDAPDPEQLLAENARDEEYSNVCAALTKTVSPEALLEAFETALNW